MKRLDGVSPSIEHRWPRESLEGEPPSSHLGVFPHVTEALRRAVPPQLRGIIHTLHMVAPAAGTR